MPNTVALLGSLLSIKPIVELAGGEVKSIRAVRTTKQANARMMSFMRQGGSLERLAILHTGAEARARDFLNQIMNEMSSIPAARYFDGQCDYGHWYARWPERLGLCGSEEVINM